MISTKNNYDYVNDLISKNNGAYMSPEEYTKYAQIASDELFDTLVGAKNQNTATYGRSRKLDNRLRPFRIAGASLAFVNSKAIIPANCRLITAIYTVNGEIPVRPLDEDRLRNVRRDPLAKPDSNDFYYGEESQQFEIFAQSTNVPCKIDYLRSPAKPVFAYTNPTGRRPVYDPANSTDFDWDANMEKEITTRILAQIGLSMSSNMVLQVANNDTVKE